jgi:hypothetical protein
MKRVTWTIGLLLALAAGCQKSGNADVDAGQGTDTEGKGVIDKAAASVKGEVIPRRS